MLLKLKMKNFFANETNISELLFRKIKEEA